MIHVTKTFLPPLEEYQDQIQRIWENKWLTNRGELTLELESRLKAHLKISNIILNTNGTLPIQIALKILAKEGEVITTPFSYVATTSAIAWGNCTPVFVDIHPKYLTIDETKIEAAITSKTKAILATHVFGNPCNVDAIKIIAKKHNLKVIYDAAHCFGVEYKGESLFNSGDISTCSFHATKIFHTAEGGALFCNNEEYELQSFYSHNFGHNGPENFYGVGINAKMSELQAAMGLAVLPHMNNIFEERKKVVDYYNNNLDLTKIHKIKLREKTKWNYCYYPVLFKNEEVLLKVICNLNKEGVFPRRYFYPSLNTLNYVPKISMPISEDISTRVLCLPLYKGLLNEELSAICAIINNSIC
jgi:dTDP-4-amino-4,6-dideoxygalactose transaminase